MNAVWVLTLWTGTGTICPGEMALPESLMLFIISRSLYGQSNADLDDGKQIQIISDI